MPQSLRRALVALLFTALWSCAGPADESLSPSDTAEQVSELRADNAGVSATVALARSTFGAKDPVTVTLTLRNAGPGALQLLRWMAPSGELEESLFSITRDGAPVPYVGAHFKRAAPTSDDLLTIAPGQSVSAEINLSAAYDFSASGSYQIRYDVARLEVTTGSARKIGALRSNELTFWADGREVFKPAPLAGGITLNSVTYNRCTATQQSQLVQAVTQATTYANGAVSYLGGSPSGTPRFTTWFGSYSSTRWNTVKSHYTAIQSAYATRPLSFDCGCKQKNVYAYVYPTQPYTIYLCGVFWQVPVSGTDSKGGTLIHEMSHFNAVASTDDWAYGQTACRSLATSNPTNAVDNADSHEYFAENNPVLQ
jgi:peptidyl-Lys metalloendopeptidase